MSPVSSSSANHAHVLASELVRALGELASARRPPASPSSRASTPRTAGSFGEAGFVRKSSGRSAVNEASFATVRNWITFAIVAHYEAGMFSQ